MKKIISIILTLIVAVGLIGCKTNNYDGSKVDLYDSKKAIEIANEYLIKLQNGDLENARKLCTDEFALSQKQDNTNNFKIQCFKIDKTVEGGNKSAIIFNIIRGNYHEPNNNLDKYSVSVIKQGDEYKINDLSAIEQAEVYSANNELRMKNVSQGESKLLLRLSDIPREVYNKEGKDLEQITTPREKFSCAGLSYTADKVAYVTSDGKDSFIGVLYIKDESAIGTMTSVESNKSQDSDNTKQILEKSQTEKISNCGVLKDCQIESVIFNALEDKLLVSYKESTGGTGLKIFNIDNAKLSDLNLKNEFPINKYNITVMYTGEEQATIKVDLLEKTEGIKDSKVGVYNINLQKEVVTQQPINS